MNINAQLDTNYIKPLQNFISIGLNLGGVQNNFSIRSATLNYDLNSNLVPSIGMWFKYKKWPALAIGIPLTSLNADTLAKSSGIKISIKSQIAKGFVIDGYVFFLKGFNFKNVGGEKYIRAMPNTFDLNVNLELYYIFNYKKFSYKSAYLFGEIQKKSKGTFSIGLATGLVSLSTKVPFFKIGNAANKELDFQALNAISISILGSYLHTFVFGKEKRWYVNGAAFIGPNIHFGATKYYRDKEDNGFLNIGFNFKYKASVGYNLNRLSFRLFSTGSFISYRPSSTSYLNNNIVDLRLGSIYRF